MSTANDKRIAKNTIFLYGRMLLTLGIQLYGSRVVLDMLGVSNYGIYNVVGGIIVIISFLNGTMAGATQRFLNFEMGGGDMTKLRLTFNGALRIHIAIAIIMLILGETIGVWYVNNELVIPPERLYAANWVYQLSLVSAIFAIIQVPYTAAVIANERMDVFAILSLLLSILKLAVALLLAFTGSFDTLIAYAWMLLGATVIVFLGYFIYARHNFPETAFDNSSPQKVINKMLSFSASDLFGTLSCTLNLQGIIIILNRFGGTILNAAGGVTLTVSGALSQFGSAIITAFRPQIIKQYAAGQFDYMQRLMINCSKFAVLLFAVIAIPAIVNMNYLLNIWLKEVPTHTTIFCQLTLLWALGDLIRMTLNCGVHATGRIFAFSIITGLIFIIELPFMSLLIEKTHQPWTVYAIHVFFMGILIIVTSFILRSLIPIFNIGKFLIKGILIPAILIFIVFAVTAYIYSILSESFTTLAITSAVSTILLTSLTWTIALDNDSRNAVISFIHRKLKPAKVR